MKTQHGGELVDSNIFITSTRFQELATLLSPANMSDKDWARLKRNIIALSEESINDIPFKPSMDVLAEKIGATTTYIESASDVLNDEDKNVSNKNKNVSNKDKKDLNDDNINSINYSYNNITPIDSTEQTANQPTSNDGKHDYDNNILLNEISKGGKSLRNSRKKSKKSKKSVTFKTNIV